ncbi:MAG: ABC transporter permease [Candidatus Solibacter sp.]|nr:ABC transporter permease [Candidatus Solibacter sp.]
MSYTAFQALVRRDLRLFFLDKRAVTMSFVAPIVIGSFFGYIFGGVDQDRPASKIAVAVVNQDNSEVSRKVVAALGADAALDVKRRALEEAREAVRGGRTMVAAVIPPGFAERAGKAFFRGRDKPEIQLLYDPSHGTEVQVVRGVLTQHVMEVISRETMSGPGSQRLLDDALRDLNQSQGMKSADQAAMRRMLQGMGEWNQRQQANPQEQANSGFSMPYTVSQEAVTARRGVKYNSMAHSFAGMCVQFILFMGIDAGMVVLYQRRSGLWKRLQAAPLSRYVIIGSRAASAAIVAVIIMLTVFGFARVVFGVRIEGSFAGFLGVCAAFAIMTATFGLLVAVLGKTPEATRGIAILVTLILVMLGGSWVPAFVFPQWLQKATFAVPTRWAVDGLDAMIWRGSGFDAAMGPIGALLAFAAVFGAIAVWRFRWESEG